MFMPPWLDWLDWLKWDCIGAGVVGKILGLWFRAVVTLAMRILHLFLPDRPSRHKTLQTGYRKASRTRAI